MKDQKQQGKKCKHKWVKPVDSDGWIGRGCQKCGLVEQIKKYEK